MDCVQKRNHTKQLITIVHTTRSKESYCKSLAPIAIATYSHSHCCCCCYLVVLFVLCNVRVLVSSLKTVSFLLPSSQYTHAAAAGLLLAVPIVCVCVCVCSTDVVATGYYRTERERRRRRRRPMRRYKDQLLRQAPPHLRIASIQNQSISQKPCFVRHKCWLRSSILFLLAYSFAITQLHHYCRRRSSSTP